MSNSYRRIFDYCAKFAQRALGHLLPQACVLCGADSGDQGLCQSCHAELPWQPALHCPVCAIPTPQGEMCGHCLSDTPAFDRSLAAWAYAWPIDRLIPAFKYGGQLTLAKPLADGLLAAVATAERPDLLLAMPLHPQRLRERGFNQSQELARLLARQLDLPLASSTVARIKLTPPQASLPLVERRKAIRGAFQVDADVHGRHIAVIDDVMTTGASLHELAKVLKKAGARRVDCWVLARTPR